jgi:hypothetical protein
MAKKERKVRKKKENVSFWIITNSNVSKERITVSSTNKIESISYMINEATIIIPKNEIIKTKKENNIKLRRLEELFG